MSDILKTFSAITLAAMLVTTSAVAQDTTAEPHDDSATSEQTQATDGNTGLALGEPVQADQNIGRNYTKETFDDWEIRCTRTADGNDPCRLYQLLFDNEGNSVAEISMYALPAGQEIAAGATIAAPLETLLTQQLTLAVDEGQARRYPFTWCSTVGCFSRIGLTAGDIASFKRGSKAFMTIIPVKAPDTNVTLDISLKGFTAGYEAVSKLNQP